MNSTNSLYYGDNLHVLRDHIPTESVDLIYLDPPFNSKRDYNLLFKSPKGHDSEAQIEAFEDTWHWNQQAEREYDELLHQPNTDLAQLMPALRSFLGENDMMAYLTMMANRLLQLHRTLKPTGSLYLHCDPTASHYLKIVLDGVFGKENFRNEIQWKRHSAHNNATRNFAFVMDSIFFYVKTDDAIFNIPRIEHDPDYIEKFFRFTDENGRRYAVNSLKNPSIRPNLTYVYKGYQPPPSGWTCNLEKMEQYDREGRLEFPKTKEGRIRLRYFLDELKGQPIGNLWDDIQALSGSQSERLGYPTQKPLALLDRIIQASSNEGDLILDPFCGCGTAVHAAQKLNRRWIGIDITHLAVSLIEKRLKDAFGPTCQFNVIGTPEDLDAARDLANRDKYQFQWWAVSLVGAQPYQGKKKGADTGIDGLKFFHDLDQQGARKIVISVKGGHIKPDDIRALNHVREREKAEIALFLTLHDPTPAMTAEAAAAGLYESPNGQKYPRLQILTIEALLTNTARAEHPDYQPNLNFKKAKKEAPGGKQRELDLS
ncbi:MAG: restriction endonuclease [Candidatus Sumerlaeaceae bacterium]|nr:restriction endonuclease [Candidatus Sumerlaeaceae bacterium]